MPFPCLVMAFGPDQPVQYGREFFRQEEGRLGLSASGVLLDREAGVVLTSAKVLEPFLESRLPHAVRRARLSNALVDPQLLETAEIFVLFGPEGDEPGWVPAHAAACFPCEASEKAFASFASRGWYCGYRKLPASWSQTPPTGPPSFGDFGLVLLQIPERYRSFLPDTARSLDALHNLDRVVLRCGSSAEVVSSPFGGINPDLFLNTHTQGVVANITADRSLVLIDARGLAGSEGGLVNSDGCAVGIVAPPLRNVDGELVAFTACLPFAAVARAAINIPTDPLRCILGAALYSAVRAAALPECISSRMSLPPPGPMGPRGTVDLGALGTSVLLVTSDKSHSWASAIAVAPDLLLTCAHLVHGRSWIEMDGSPVQRHDGTFRCRVVQGRRPHLISNVMAREIYSTNHTMDLALLECKGVDPPFQVLPWVLEHDVPGSGGPPLVVESGAYDEGQQVWAVGFGLFSPEVALPSATVTKGTLAKAIRNRMSDVCILQSSAAVYQGNSGGALLTEKGLVGLVTTNAKELNTVSGHGVRVLPHVNFALPTSYFAPLLRYLRSRDPSDLDVFDDHVKALQAAGDADRALWRLETAPLAVPSWVQDRTARARRRFEELVGEPDVGDGPAAAAASGPLVARPKFRSRF
mmetsp:Transcript_49988/g.109263  ORF Transcript_49988/g.109263 Transcript_49988/m.109263 type:complete len:639 (+) Transcript_49988:52-1968(+)